MAWLTSIRPLLETLYFIASIGLFATVILGIQQMKLLKKDISDRNKRAAIEKGVEYLHNFATAYIPKFDQFREHVLNEGVSFYTGPFDENFIYNGHYSSKDPEVVQRLKVYEKYEATNLANELEFFAAVVLSGLADEELIFNPLSTVTIEIIECLYPVYCKHRNDIDSRMFTKTLELYKMWKARINYIDELKEKRRKSEAHKLGRRKVVPFGMSK
jgi:hypothetical protein